MILLAQLFIFWDKEFFLWLFYRSGTGEGRSLLMNKKKEEKI